MNEAIKEVLKLLLHKHIIGHKHFPEDLLIKNRIRHLPRYEQREFYEEYFTLVNKGYFWRLKKRTGKGTEWHISLNPEYLHEIIEIIGELE